MRQVAKVDNSLQERRGILELIERARKDSVSLPELEQIGVQLRQAGKRALPPLIRELWRENSGELITRYTYLLDFFEEESWLDRLIQIALTRQDLADDAKSALLIALEGYGVDVYAPPFSGEFTGVANKLCHVVQEGIRLEDEGTVTFLDEFLSYPSEVQHVVIRELPKSGDGHAARMLEAMLWHEDRAIVQAALTALGSIRSPKAAGILARFIEDGEPTLSAQAEKSLRRLTFLGVEAPELVALLPFHAAYATAPDGDGYRSLFISRWVADGKLAALYMQVHERRGLLAAWGAGALSEEEFHVELEGFSAQDDLHEVPADYLLDLLRDALYWSRDLCYLPADFYMRRGLFSGHDMTAAPYRPVFEEYQQKWGLSYREGEEISRELFADAFFNGWFMASQRVYDFAEQYKGAELGEQELVLERFCAELVAPELELIRDRLLAGADLMRRCNRDSVFVGRVVALAGSLVGNPLPHHLHPFLRAFALESMEIAKEALAQGAEDRLQAAAEEL